MKSPHSHPDFKEAQTTVQFLLGPIKIKDGLFMGDQLAARDIEFIITNKVTHVINTVSKSIPNLYERFGVQYLSVHWTQKEENIFDKKNNAVNAIFNFIEEAMEQGESCLIHSLHGKSRSCAVLVAYLMRKYNWSLNKSLQLVNSKKEGLQIRNNYLVQMQQLQKRMQQFGKLSNFWNQIKNQEDLLLTNTFHNSKKSYPSEMIPKKTNRKRVVFDQKLVHKIVPTNNLSVTMNRFKDQQEKRDIRKPKSILKGFLDENQQQNVKQFNVQPDQKQKMVNNINGNIVHVTVNNFITTEKKPDNFSKTFNSRPYSSDNKQRDKKNTTYDIKPNKLFGYESPSTNIKTAFQSKLTGKIGVPSSVATKNIKKKEEIKNPVMAYERPQSANIQADRKKIKNPLTYGTGIGMGREEMMVTGKKRYPSSNPRQQLYKFK